MYKLVSLKRNGKSYTLTVSVDGVEKVIYLYWGTSRNWGRCLKPKKDIKLFWEIKSQIPRFLGKIYTAEQSLKKTGDIYYFEDRYLPTTDIYRSARAHEYYHKARGGF